MKIESIDLFETGYHSISEEDYWKGMEEAQNLETQIDNLERQNKMLEVEEEFLYR